MSKSCLPTMLVNQPLFMLVDQRLAIGQLFSWGWDSWTEELSVQQLYNLIKFTTTRRALHMFGQKCACPTDCGDNTDGKNVVTFPQTPNTAWQVLSLEARNSNERWVMLVTANPGGRMRFPSSYQWVNPESMATELSILRLVYMILQDCIKPSSSVCRL